MLFVVVSEQQGDRYFPMYRGLNLEYLLFNSTTEMMVPTIRTRKKWMLMYYWRSFVNGNTSWTTTIQVAKNIGTWPFYWRSKTCAAHRIRHATHSDSLKNTQFATHPRAASSSKTQGSLRHSPLRTKSVICMSSISHAFPLMVVISHLQNQKRDFHFS